ncbi:hemoglobin/transferrin/lactoferrin receptor protein [Flavobacteriaceae bacterium MAR_2010_188]|nr:hemoglobin/transferrin/lactoferrin receptor protein [Flavobacteriaceae bacterium MAR_2010_188]
MRFILMLSLSVLFSITAWSQTVRVLDQSSQEPISGVTVYNKDKSKFQSTDLDGEVSLDAFSNDELIYFQSSLTGISSIRKSQIISEGNIVYLKEKIEYLNEVVISASKFEQNRKEIPQKIVNVTAEDIKFMNPQTSADLLEATGNVYIQKSQLGGGSPIIRGFSTNRLLITVDGVRMNNAIFRGGNLQNVISIDPFTIQTTEVTLGAGSIVYGSDAIGGVMSFYTKKPMLSYKDSLYVRAGGSARYATANNEKTINAQFNIGLKKWAFLTNLTYSDFDDLRMGKHGPVDYLRPEYVVTENGMDKIVQNDDPLIQVPTGYDQINLMQKARYEAGTDLSMDFGLYYSTTSDYARYDRLIRYNGDNLWSAEWYYGPQSWFMGNYNITKLSSSSTLYDKFQGTLAYQNFQESRVDRNFQSEIRNKRDEAVNAYSVNLDFEKFLSEKFELFYGAEYVFNKILSNGSEENIMTNVEVPAVSRYPDGSDWQSIAAYTSVKFKPSDGLVLQSGVRYNHIVSHSDFTENNQYLNLPFNEAEINSGALTGTLGLTYNPNETVQFKANASTAFRAPNIDDIGKVFDSEPGSVVVPNSNLKPEYAYGGDLDLRLDFNKKFIFDSAIFYTYLDNALIRRDFSIDGQTQIEYDGELSNVQAVQNAASANVYGLELLARYNFTDQFHIVSKYNFIRGTENENGEKLPVRHVAPDFGNTHIVWEKDKLKMDAYAQYNAEFTNEELAPSEREKDFIYALDENGNPYSPSWITFNLRTKYQFSDRFSMFLTLENITDQRYKTYSSGIASAGRNFIVSLNYSL